MFNIYWNKYKQVYTKVTLNVDGREVDTGLEIGKDIYHFKHSEDEYKGLADSPIDYCYNWLVFYAIAVEVNSNMVGRGNLGIVLPIFEKEMQKSLDGFVGEETVGGETKKSDLEINY